MQQEAIDQLTRIADALEGIETRLDALEELQDTAEQFIRINTKNRGLPETVTPLYILNARAGAFGKDTPT